MMLNLGGTYRAVDPKQTLAKIEPLLWNEFGITRIANITHLDHVGIPTYLAIRPKAKLLTTAQGKGLDDDLAKISAMMESIEGWHCETMDEPSLFGAYQTLKHDYPLCEFHPAMNHGPFEWVDIETLEIPWAQGTELITGKEIYFPYTMINVNTAYYRPGYRYFPPRTNGLASGNTYEEAICHALYELIERESEASNTLFMTSPQIDLTTITSPFLLTLLEKISQSRLSLEVWPLMNDYGIPCYAAVVYDLDDVRGVGLQFGSGAHFSSVVALSRAITEAIQGRVTMISGSRDDHTPRLYRKNKQNIPYLVKAFNVARENKIFFTETPALNDFSVCLHDLLQVLKQRGYSQVILYNHTRDEFDIPVVHIVVPGFRYIHGTCFACPVST
jgi:ribosomal protein S12 methylthiotransferase accessory factor